MRWKVSKQVMKLFPHPNADKLEVGRVGDYQVVVQKGLYRDGDMVVFAPEKSVLTGALRDEFDKYLGGTDRNKVHSVRLRGELSCGIIVPPHLLPDLSSYAVSEDVSQVVGISKYVPQVPKEMMGEAEAARVLSSFVRHDVLHFTVYERDFVPGERVLVTEKIHGTQCSCVLDLDGKRAVMSKGLADEEVAFKEGQDNLYWRAVKASRVFQKIDELMVKVPGRSSLSGVQVFGEVVPCPNGFKYGLDGQPRLIVFRVEVLRHGGVERVQYDDPINPFREDWVPVLYDDVFADEALAAQEGRPTFRKVVGKLCQGNELISGSGLHLREGVVVEPYVPRLASDGEELRVKVINPDYRETGEEFN